MTHEVIGAGFGRTGTLSLKVALETLGFAPCYHMAEVLLERPGLAEGHIDAWHDFLCCGRPMDWRWLLSGYRASTDFPTCLFYRELMEVFPNARVVLTVRDAESWFESFQALGKASMNMVDAAGDDPRMKKWGDLGRAMLQAHVRDGALDRDTSMRVFERHIEEVKATVPRDRLLVYRVGEGWERLCEFLGCEVPEADFPHLNERGMIEQMLGALAGRG